MVLGFPTPGSSLRDSFSTPFYSEAGAGDAVSAGTIAEYTCDRGFELLGPARRLCGENGTWSPQGIPFCGKYIFFIKCVRLTYLQTKVIQ